MWQRREGGSISDQIYVTSFLKGLEFIFVIPGYGERSANVEDDGLRPQRQSAQLRAARQGGDQEHGWDQKEQWTLGKAGRNDQKNFKERKFRWRVTRQVTFSAKTGNTCWVCSKPKQRHVRWNKQNVLDLIYPHKNKMCYACVLWMKTLLSSLKRENLTGGRTPYQTVSSKSLTSF